LIAKFSAKSHGITQHGVPQATDYYGPYWYIISHIYAMKTNRYLPPHTEHSAVPEDWLLLDDDEVDVTWRLNTGGAEDGLTEPLDAMVLLCTGTIWPVYITTKPISGQVVTITCALTLHSATDNAWNSNECTNVTVYSIGTCESEIFVRIESRIESAATIQIRIESGCSLRAQYRLN